MKMIPSPICKRGDRNIYCPKYEECLDHAVDRKWRTWNCSECSFKLIQEATQSVRTVNDTNVVYELPSTLPFDMWQRWG